MKTPVAGHPLPMGEGEARPFSLLVVEQRRVKLLARGMRYGHYASRVALKASR